MPTVDSRLHPPRAVPDASTFRFTGATLEGDGPAPPTTGWTFEIGETGVALSGSAAGPRWTVRRSDLTAVDLGPVRRGPLGRPSVPVDVVVGARTTRLWVDGGPAHAVQLEGLATWIGTARGHRRTRRSGRVALVTGSASLLAAGVLAVALASVHGGSTPAPRVVAPDLPSADQQLADAVLLTRHDLPPGWTVGSVGGAPVTTHDRTAQAAIATAFSHCSGVSGQQAAFVLGGRTADETAQSSSPVFVGPSPAERSGAALELQTEATVVRTNRDEGTDLALLGNPDVPRCAAVAIASELQLGVDDATGGTGRPGPPSATVLHLVAPAGEQAVGLETTFTVSDGSTAIPVQVVDATVGSGRIEAQFQAFAIGGTVPVLVVSASLTTLELRVASQGRSVTV